MLGDHVEKEEATHAYADHSKFDEVFQPKEKVELGDGLIEMAVWVKMHGVQKNKAFEDIEIEKKLPESWRG